MLKIWIMIIISMHSGQPKSTTITVLGFDTENGCVSKVEKAKEAVKRKYDQVQIDCVESPLLK